MKTPITLDQMTLLKIDAIRARINQAWAETYAVYNDADSGAISPEQATERLSKILAPLQLSPAGRVATSNACASGASKLPAGEQLATAEVAS